MVNRKRPAYYWLVYTAKGLAFCCLSWLTSSPEPLTSPQHPGFSPAPLQRQPGWMGWEQTHAQLALIHPETRTTHPEAGCTNRRTLQDASYPPRGTSAVSARWDTLWSGSPCLSQSLYGCRKQVDHRAWNISTSSRSNLSFQHPFLMGRV